MPRKLTFPGLQEKFENVLKGILNDEKIYQTNDIIKKLKEKKEVLTDAEIEDLTNNWANYISRAKRHEVIISHGTKQGYQLNKEIMQSEESKEQTSNESISSPASPVDVQNELKIRENWESLMHLPTTILLSYEFSARLYSLKQRTSKMKWANPDMLMIRNSQGYTSEDNQISHEILDLVDTTPKYILSSIELKYGMGRSRTNVLSALSETAINGNWANENWLVYMDNPEDPSVFEDDSMEYAQTNGIGIIKIEVLNGKSKDAPELSMIVISPAKIRHQLLLNSDFTKDGKKSGLVSAIEAIVSEYNEKGSYLDYQYNYAKLAELLIQAFDNLLIQPGFSSEDIESNQKVFKTIGTNKEYRAMIYNAILNFLPKAIEMPIPGIEESIKQDLKKLDDYPRVRYDKIMAYSKLLKNITEK